MTKDAALRQAREVIAIASLIVKGRPHVTLTEVDLSEALTSIDAALAGEAKAPTEPPPQPPSWLPAETFHAMSAAAQVAVQPHLATWQANMVVMAALSAIPTPAVVRSEDVSDEMLDEAGLILEQDAPQSDKYRRLIAWAMTHRRESNNA